MLWISKMLARDANFRYMYPGYHISLPRSKFGLNIIPISTKFIQCQLTIRNCINNSSNEDLKFIHQEASQGKNVQYDMFKSTREVLKVMRKEKEEHIATLSSQNLIINSIWNFVMVLTQAYWFSALDSLPKNVYNFCIRYIKNNASNKQKPAVVAKEAYFPMFFLW